MFTLGRTFLLPLILTREYIYVFTGRTGPFIAAKVQPYLPFKNHPNRTTASAFRTQIRLIPHFTPFPSSNRPSPSRRTMATSSKVKLSTSEHPAFYLPNMNQEGADMTSELLTENHNIHHIFFNQEGFHVCSSLATLKA